MAKNKRYLRQYFHRVEVMFADCEVRKAAKILLIKDRPSCLGSRSANHDTAPVDREHRRWRRRVHLVMCIARHRRVEGQLMDGAARKAL